MSSQPFVSVIIPAYNRFEFLKEAITSVKIQTYRCFEIIVVDDGSTDNTSDLLDRTGVLYVKIRHTGKPGHTRNIGALRASGRYLAFLDSDDLWKSNKLEMQVLFFNKNPDILFCHTREIWRRGNDIVSQKNQNHRRSGNIFDDALKKCIVGPSTVMLTKKLFFDSGMFNPKIEIAEDYEFWLRICDRHLIGYVDKPLTEKRSGHPDQLSNKYDQIEIFRLKALRADVDEGIFSGTHLQLARSELVRKCRIYAAGCRKRGRVSESAHYDSLADYHQKQTSADLCG